MITCIKCHKELLEYEAKYFMCYKCEQEELSIQESKHKKEYEEGMKKLRELNERGTL